ncbi:MAG: hypothetical protein WA154_11170 [Moraxellaceae bacterium]
MPNITFLKKLFRNPITVASVGDPPGRAPIRVTHIAIPGKQGRSGLAITGPWDMTPSAVSCAYPLDDDGTIPAAFGFGHAGPAVGDGQSLSYTRVGGATGDTALLMPADPLGADSFDLPTTAPVSFECHIEAAGGSTVGLTVLWHNAGAFAGGFSQGSAVDGDVITFTVGTDGAVSWKKNGVAQAGTATIPAGRKFTPYLYVRDQSGDTGAVLASLVTAASSILYGTGNDLCGNAIAGTATLPTGAAAGNCYEVTVAGSYGGTDYVVGDLAVVRSDASSVTRIPAAGMGAAEVAAAVAVAVLAHEADADPHGDRAYADAQDTILQAAIDLKLDADAYVQHFKGKYVSEAALGIAHPTGIDGDYAVVDSGVGEEARQFVWDAEGGWVDSGDIRNGTTTDQIAEGSTNLWFTYARVRSTLLTGLSLVYGGAISATDTVLSAIGKLQAFITATQAQLDAHVGSTSNPHGVTLGQLVSTYTWAGKPSAATAGSGAEVFISDVGVNGSRWRSDGADWHPVNGNVVLARSAVARGIAPSGTIGTGSSGQLTLGTVLRRIYSEGVWLYLPAIATTPAIAAGMYYCVMSSTTVGTIYSSGPGSAALNISAGASYTGLIVTSYELLNVPVPGSVMGVNGALRITTAWTNNNSAGAKTPIVKFGGSGGASLFALNNTTNPSHRYQQQIENRGLAAAQVASSTLLTGFGAASTAPADPAINTAANTSVSVMGGLAVATDWIMLESCTVELLS